LLDERRFRNKARALGGMRMGPHDSAGLNL
jgi:hypothetical protein